MNVFIIFSRWNNGVLAVCDNWQTVQDKKKEIKKERNYSENEIWIDEYQIFQSESIVKKIIDHI